MYEVEVSDSDDGKFSQFHRKQEYQDYNTFIVRLKIHFSNNYLLKC